jgi:hypothetical protein
MSLSKRRYAYVDFTTEQQVPVFAKTTGAVRTAADNQEDYFRVNDTYFELIQTGANTLLASTGFTPSATGWKIPLDNTDGDGMEITQGIVTGVPTPMKFVTGTDAFFIKVKMEVTTLANIDALGVGFRNILAYADITTPATLASVYDDKFYLGVNDNAGAVVGIESLAGSDTTTTATNTPIVSGTAFTFEVRVASDLTVTALVDGTEDVLISAASPVVTTAITMVPSIVVVATGAGATNVELVEYECGLLAE